MPGTDFLKHPIIFVEHPSEQCHEAIFKGINDYARSRGLNAAAGSFFFAAFDEHSTMVAGLSGFDNFGSVEIGGLWVHEAVRGKGYGRALVQRAEAWGREQSCKAITVFTLKEWPAFAWYQKIGFILEFERSGHANNSIGCYLIKKLV